MNEGENSVSLGALPTAAAWPGRRRIGNFELQSVLVCGQAGLVYRSWDHALTRPVAIKEYLPAALAQREANGDVSLAGPDTTELFERGRYAFLDEARTLARCDHPCLVRVLDLLEAHGTVYRVMPWYSGRVLLDVRHKMSGPLGEPALRLLLDNLIGALEDYQRVGGVHRGVDPSQVLLLDDGRALLLGPRAATRALQGGSAPAMAPEPGLAPPEQAGARNSQPQGPWTDFYSLAALARFCITGELPPAAGPGDPEPLAETVQRLFADQPVARYATPLLDALDAALSPDIAKRPQTAAQFREWLLRAKPRGPASTHPSTHLPVDARDPAGAVGAEEPAPHVQAFDAEAGDFFQQAVDPVAEPAGPLFAPDQHSMPPALAAPPGPGDLRAVRSPPAGRRHRALWAGLALALVAAVGFGVQELQAPPFRLTLAALAEPPATVLQQPVAQAPVPRVAPPERVAALPAQAATAEPVLPVTDERPQPGPSAPPDAPATRAAPAAAPAIATATARQPAADTAEGPGATSPRQECGARTEFSLYRCMQQKCSLAKWRRHPQCERLEATDSVE